MIIDFKDLDTQILTQNALRVQTPQYKPSEYKRPKMCLKMSISPGPTFGILRYFIHYDSYSLTFSF